MGLLMKIGRPILFKISALPKKPFFKVGQVRHKNDTHPK